MASSAPEPDRLLRVGEVVLAAAELPPAARDAFFERLTLADPELLAEVRRWLALAGDMPDSFLALPAAEALASAAGLEADVEDGEDGPERDDGPTAPVAASDRYELGEVVGEGGMGRVIRAFDRQLGRPVALKFLDRLQPGARRRFLREAQAQARIRHEHVLPVYETGELVGKPYIAMRWVEGPTLTALRGELSLEQKVHLFAEIAEALHAAHREGLVHRDVKPSNLLVEPTPDGGWKPWVADFGIALERDEAAGGRATFAGTPAYLAPEVLSGTGAPVDRRVDVYGLGVSLYEILTGELPFRDDDLFALLRKVENEAPRPPRQLVPSLPAELDALVLKCLEKDPAKRYPSARALADELRRYLRGEVVEAHAASLAYRLTRFALRHRRALVAGSGAVLLLAAALVVATFLGFEARAANRRAELRRGQAEDLIGFMLTDLRDRLEPLGRLELLDRVGERAMAYFAAVPRTELSEAELARRSQALHQIGEVRIRQGDLAAALPPLEESLGLAQALAERRPDDGPTLFGLGQSHYWVGHVHWERGDLADARPHFERYLEISRDLLARAPEDDDARLELSYALSNLGSVARQQGDLAAALGYFEQTLDLQRRLVAAAPADLALASELASTHELVALTQLGLGRLADAREHLDAVLALYQDLVARAPGDFQYREFLGTAHDSLERWLEARGEIAAAQEHAEAAEAIFSALVAHDPDNQVWRWQRANARLKQGYLLVFAGRPEPGRRRLREVHNEATARLAGDAGDRRWQLLADRSALRLAAVEAEAGDTGAARALLASARDRLSARLDRDPRDTDALRWLAEVHLAAARLEPRREAAEGLRREARERLAPAIDTASPAELTAAWAAVLLALGETAEARPWIERLAAAGYRHPDLVAARRAAGLDRTAASLR